MSKTKKKKGRGMFVFICILAFRFVCGLGCLLRFSMGHLH